MFKEVVLDVVSRFCQIPKNQITPATQIAPEHQTEVIEHAVLHSGVPLLFHDRTGLTVERLANELEEEWKRRH